MDEINLDAKSTALVLIDLQRGILGRDTAPHPTSKVLGNAVRLADRFRQLGATVVLVHVSFSDDGKDVLTTPVDSPFTVRSGQMPPNWTE